jgi:hypothetical protein
LKISLPSDPLHGTWQRNFFKKILCRVLSTAALGKENIFFENLFAECPSAWHPTKKKDFFKKKSLLSAHHPGTRQRKYFLKKICLPSVPLQGTRQRNFFLKNSLPSAIFPGTQQSWETIQNCLGFFSFAECFWHCTRQGFLCRVLHSTK